MTRQEAADLLDLIIMEAPRLRAAGVLTVSLGVAGFTLAPSEQQSTIGEVEDDEPPKDLLHDAWTHGRPNENSPRSVQVKRRSAV